MMSRRALALGIAASLGTAAAAPSLASELLVIGNDRFMTPGTRSLQNPTNDARLIAQTFASLGYRCALLQNAARKDYFAALASFAGRAGARPTRLVVYVASHGLSVDGDSYLLATDTDIGSIRRVMATGISSRQTVRTLCRSGADSVVMLWDACRNSGAPGDASGLTPFAAEDVQGPASGVTISYSTQLGQAATDGPAGENSFYARALADLLRDEPTVTIGGLLIGMEQRVSEATGGRQRPSAYCSMPSGGRLLA